MTAEVRLALTDLEAAVKSGAAVLPFEPITPDPGVGRSNFVLLTGAAAELGGSCGKSFLITAYSCEAADDGIYIAGCNPEGKSELGILIHFYGKTITDELFYILNQNVKRLMRLPHLMVKGSDGEIWIRIEKNGEETLTLAKIGSTFVARVKEEFPEVEGCSLIFFTDCPELFEAGKILSDRWQERNQALKAKVWESRGYNFTDCHVLGHCGQCSDKKLCANIRKMGKEVERVREIVIEKE